MRAVFVGMATLALAIFTGCTQGTPGGPGATRPATTGTTTHTTSHRQAEEPFTQRQVTEPTRKQTDETFTLSMPLLSTSIKQGEAKAVTIGVRRGTNFTEDVALRFTDLPKGVTIEPASPMIKASDREAKVTVKAADDAPIGDFTIKVAGHPSRGPDALNELKVTVRKK